MNAIKHNPDPRAELPKAVYEKPAMQVYNIEMEEAMLAGYGSDSKDGGSWGGEY